MHHRKGFTIIELLVVVGIIGLLASLAVVSFSSAQVRARDSKRLADIRSVLAGLTSATASSQSGQVVLCTTAGAAIGASAAAATAIDTVKGCAGAAGSCSAGCADILPQYVNLANIKDPSGSATNCAGAAGAPCHFAIWGNPGMGDSFTILFNTEQTNLSGLSQTSNHTATQTGIY